MAVINSRMIKTYEENIPLWPKRRNLFRRLCPRLETRRRRVSSPRCMLFFSVLSSTNDYLQGHDGFPNVGLRLLDTRVN